MTEEHEDQTEQRLKDSMNGPRALKPDEQHHYLGTFRERVYLTISVAQARQQDWTTTTKAVLEQHPQAQLIINGNLPSKLTHPYQLVVIKVGNRFTIKTDPFYHTRPGDLAIVIADDHAVYQSPVDVAKVARGASRQPSRHQVGQQSTTGWHHLFH
ncbi:YueI family protein [uncultured Limosilactobacillus sp.]|uniref:YueI family protein n=1 Tax=uncultured Limosilactobacillus sp. TaxID=2837629 RepID=UPI0025CF5856|nr:YueI family protein [uncultured Limosilactobacillus sp.]